MPSFEELGINLDGLLSKYANNNNNIINSTNNYLIGDTDLAGKNGGVNADVEFQSAKLKNSAYKKLREKVAKSKVMWFSCAPERRPQSVIFELPTSDDTGAPAHTRAGLAGFSSPYSASRSRSPSGGSGSLAALLTPRNT